MLLLLYPLITDDDDEVSVARNLFTSLLLMQSLQSTVGSQLHLHSSLQNWIHIMMTAARCIFSAVMQSDIFHIFTTLHSPTELVASGNTGSVICWSWAGQVCTGGGFMRNWQCTPADCTLLYTTVHHVTGVQARLGQIWNYLLPNIGHNSWRKLGKHLSRSSIKTDCSSPSLDCEYCSWWYCWRWCCQDHDWRVNCDIQDQ